MKLIYEFMIMITCMITVLVGGILIGYNIDKSFIQEWLQSSKTISSTNCSNLSFDDVVNCLNQNFKSWFIYNISNVGKELNYSQLREQGGVCYHAAKWYASEAKAMGYNSTTAVFDGDVVGHRIAIIYRGDLSRYCILDQNTIVGCMNLTVVPRE